MSHGRQFLLYAVLAAQWIWKTHMSHGGGALLLAEASNRLGCRHFGGFRGDTVFEIAASKFRRRKARDRKKQRAKALGEI